MCGPIFVHLGSSLRSAHTNVERCGRHQCLKKLQAEGERQGAPLVLELLLEGIVLVKAFARHKDILCDKSISISCRLKIFNAVVGQTVLYGAEAWMEMIRSCQRTLFCGEGWDERG